MIWAIALQALSANINVVLDLGFSERTQRQRLYGWASAAGVQYQLHYLDLARDVRWNRVQARNLQRASASLQVDKDTFEWMEGYFEPPTAQELKDASGSVVTT